MVGYKQQPDMVGVVFALALAAVIGMAFYRFLVAYGGHLLTTLTQN
jgi:high-affinity Fe2+/Pb2+ permease